MDFKKPTFTSNSIAKYLRQNLTPAEATLWKCLRRKTLGVTFRRQCPIGEYILDFYCDKAKLCIELDGNVHDSISAYGHDERRTRYLNNLGITVMRFSNSAVLDNLNAVLQSIINFLENPHLITGDIRNVSL